MDKLGNFLQVGDTVVYGCGSLDNGEICEIYYGEITAFDSDLPHMLWVEGYGEMLQASYLIKVVVDGAAA